MKIGIIFATINNFRGLAEAIHSIKTAHDYRIYIVDQWRWNRPLAKAWNDGARLAFEEGCDYALICNDDILFAPECIDALVSELIRLRPENVLMTSPNNIILELADPYAILQYQRKNTDPIGISDHPNFSCFCVGPEYFELVGTFDENFVPAWFEDNDAHRRAELLGYRLVATSAAPQVHFGGQSTAQLENPDSTKSREYYVRKWGGLPVSHPVAEEEKETFTHPFNDPAISPKDWSLA